MKNTSQTTCFQQGVLFDIIEPVEKKSRGQQLCKELLEKKKHTLNLQWHNDFQTTGVEGFPMLEPFVDELPTFFIPFSERNKKLYNCGVHCFLYDYMIDRTWNAPPRVVPSLKQYRCVVAPDFSIFTDMPRAVNVWNIYRNRWVSSYWQSQGIKVIPSASWGSVDSFEYCFDGLPENSVIAIGHSTAGKDKSFKRLYRMGVETLIEKKRPTKLMVYGSPLDFNVNTDIVYQEGFVVKKLRRL